MGVGQRSGVAGAGVAAALALAAALAAVDAVAETVVFGPQREPMTVYLPSDAHPEERAAADDLARILALMSGQPAPPVESEHRAGRRGGFFIGATRAAAAALPALRVAPAEAPPHARDERGPLLDRDGFRLVTVGERVFVQGASAEGTAFGVAYLLRRYGGVRWFVPGEFGEVVPRRDEWRLPTLREVREPAWLSRELWGLHPPPGDRWEVRNGLRRRYAFSHNLEWVFPRELFEDHPEWFPWIDGRRYQPGPGRDFRWQPNLALPEVAEFAAAAAARHFAAHPDEATFSLGTNDSMRFDQSAATRERVLPMRYFRGMPDYSALVFDFMNRAAARLAQTHPGKRLGQLAYFWTENVPPFPVAPTVLPYLTADRSQYWDPVFRAQDEALIRRWVRAGPEIVGIYDYSYGGQYLVPRIYHRALVEAVRGAWLAGARGYFAESNTSWGFDAFKVWATARLAWDGWAELEELEDEFFPAYYEAAEVPMRRFFALAEEQWMGQRGPSYWIKYYEQEDQARLFPPEVRARMREALAEAAQRANTPAVRARVALTERAWGVTEAFTAFDEVRREGWEVPRWEAARAATHEGWLEDYARRRAELVAAYAEGTRGRPAAKRAWKLDTFVQNDPAPSVVWAALEGGADARAWAAAAERAVAQAGEGEFGARMAGDAVLAVRAWRELRERPRPNLAVNGVFERAAAEPFGPQFLFPHFNPVPAAWTVRALPTERARVALTREAARNGERGLRVEGAWDSQIFRWQRAVPGTVYVLSGWMRGRTTPGADAGLLLTFLRADESLAAPARTVTLPKGMVQDWRRLVLVGEAPADAAWVGIGVAALRQMGADFVDADDVELWALPGER